MQPSPPDRVQDILEKILRYLATHPDAADTPEGIETWWLAGRGGKPGDALRLALEVLIRRHVLIRAVLPGGSVIYRRPQPPDPARADP